MYTFYPEIIGNIFNNVRARVTNVVGNLLFARASNTEQQQEQQQTQDEIEKTNKKVSTLKIMNVKMNYEHQNKLNLDRGGSEGNSKAKEITVNEQIFKDDEIDKPISHNEMEMNNKMLHKNEIVKDEKLMGNGGKKLNNDTSSTDIIDAFFDLDSDDIFYEIERNSTNQIVQRPRLFPLIISSLVKYKNQSDSGFLQNTTIKERNRIRALYMLRPIIGVLRRKAENSKVREQLRQIQKIMLENAKRNLSESQPSSSSLYQLSSQHEMHELARIRAKTALADAFDRHSDSKAPSVEYIKKDNNTIVSNANLLSSPSSSSSSTTNSRLGNSSNEIQRRNDIDNTISYIEDDNNLDLDNNDEHKSNNNNGDIDENDIDESKSSSAFTDTFGILILELIGTIAGLTWGVFSQLSHFLQGMRN